MSRTVQEGRYGHAVANGVVACLFAVTGPLAILLNVALDGGLDRATIDSWILAAYVVGGGLSVVFSVRYRQPLALAWTIPGVVLLGPALRNLTFAEVVGAYVMTAVVLVVLGVTGWARRAMRIVPLPILMGMVAGIFLPFVIDVITGFVEQPLLVGVMSATFFTVLATPVVARKLPPVLAALLAGGAVIALTPDFSFDGVGLAVARPVVVAPTWSWSAAFELVVPLTLAWIHADLEFSA